MLYFGGGNMPKEPKIRTVLKAKPPYQLNRFPKSFFNKLGKELVYLVATRSTLTLEGADWEQIFALCIGAEWKPSNVGLDDIVLNNCCWGAKTVKANSNNIFAQKRVRLISGRNSPAYSYESVDFLTKPPSEIGEMVLRIWNERVSGVRQVYKFVRTIVLIKSKDFKQFILFETETYRYNPDEYTWRRNSRGNLEGYDNSGKHIFTWQPHGSQFTIIEDIPDDAVLFEVKHPQPLLKDDIIKALGYSSEWLTIVDKQGI